MPIQSLCSTFKDAITLIFNWSLPAFFLREWWEVYCKRWKFIRDKKVRGSTEVKEEGVVYMEVRVNKL